MAMNTTMAMPWGNNCLKLKFFIEKNCIAK
jgi:hypothetical protein